MKPVNAVALFRELIALLPKRIEADGCELTLADNPRATVVIVSGIGASHRTVAVIRRRLLKDGFDVIALSMGWQDFSDGVLGLAHMAERLRAIVKPLARRKRPVFLVAHSAGGLVSRYFLQALGGDEFCDGLVTLGTPHRGTWMAAFGFLTHLALKARVLWEMLPVSPFVRRLNRTHWSEEMRMLSIYSCEDLVCPERCTRLPATWNSRNIQTEVMDGLSHFDFLLSKRCYQSVLGFLLEQLARIEGETQQKAQ